MVQADRLVATAAIAAGHLHQGQIVVVAEAEKHHLHALLIQARANGHSEHAVVEPLRAFEIGHFQHHVAEGMDFHGLSPLAKQGLGRYTRLVPVIFGQVAAAVNERLRYFR